MSSLESVGGADARPVETHDRRHPIAGGTRVKGSQKARKLQKKVVQTSLTERRVEKWAVAAEQAGPDRTRA
jgi:hypothetical protein